VPSAAVQETERAAESGSITNRYPYLDEADGTAERACYFEEITRWEFTNEYRFGDFLADP